MVRKPNKTHENLIPMKINYHTVLTQQLTHHITGQPS